MNKIWGYYLSEITQSQKGKCIWFHLYEEFKIPKHIDTEVERGLPGVGGGGMKIANQETYSLNYARVVSSGGLLYNFIST